MIFSPHKTRNKPLSIDPSLDSSLPSEPIIHYPSLLISCPDSLFNSSCFPEYHTTTIPSPFHHFQSTFPRKFSLNRLENLLQSTDNDEEWLKFLDCQFESQTSALCEPDFSEINYDPTSLSQIGENCWINSEIGRFTLSRYFNGSRDEPSHTTISSQSLESLVSQDYELNVQYSPCIRNPSSYLTSSTTTSKNYGLINLLTKALANYSLIIRPSESIENAKIQSSTGEEEEKPIVDLFQKTREAFLKIQNEIFPNRETKTMANQKKQKHAQRTTRLTAKLMRVPSKEKVKKCRQNPLKIIPPCESSSTTGSRNKKKQQTTRNRRKRSIRRHTQKRDNSSQKEHEEEHEEEEKCPVDQHSHEEEEKQTASELNSSGSLKMMKDSETPEELSISPVRTEKNEGHNMGEILDKLNKIEQEKKASEPEKTRFRLVKKKPERKRDNLNNSVYSNDTSYYQNYRDNNYQIASRSIPKPGCLPDPFILPMMEQNDAERISHRETVECAKENDEFKEEEEDEENETREGSQKEQESLYDRLQQFDELGEFVITKAILVDEQNLNNKVRGIISEKWSNSDSKEQDTEDYFEERLSQLSHSVASEAGGTPNKKEAALVNDNEGFIPVTNKKKPHGRRRKDGEKNRREYEYEVKSRQEKPKKSEERSRYNPKGATQTIVYEPKNNSGTAKVIIPVTNGTPIKSPAKISKAPDSTNYPTLAETYQPKPAVPAGSSTQKPQRKALSLKSPGLDLNVIKNTKMKEFARQHFEKKLENDIYEHVTRLTEKSNDMMPYRMMAHNRIDYCLKRIFSGFNVQTKIFGSCATGLALPTSDIDICICGAPTYVRSDITTYLTTIYDKLKKFKWVVNIKNVLSANVPIMKLEIDPTIEFSELYEKLDEFSMLKGIIEEFPGELNELKDLGSKRIKIDLSIESLNIMPMMGCSSSHLGYKSTDFVQKMLEEHTSLYTIAILLKEFLNNRGFLDNYQGGLSSYVLVVMIVAIFRKFKDEGETKSFKRLLNFYGKEFQPERMGISIVGTEPFFPLTYCYEEAPLYILDNMNFMGRNLGQGAFAIKKILGEFENAANLLKTAEEKIGEIAIKYKEKINSLEDLEKIDDEELKNVVKENLVDIIIGNGNL